MNPRPNAVIATLILALALVSPAGVVRAEPPAAGESMLLAQAPPPGQPLPQDQQLPPGQQRQPGQRRPPGQPGYPPPPPPGPGPRPWPGPGPGPRPWPGPGPGPGPWGGGSGWRAQVLAQCAQEQAYCAQMCAASYYGEYREQCYINCNAVYVACVNRANAMP